MKWLDRALIVGPYLLLATSEREYQRAMTHCKVAMTDRLNWIPDGKNARSHTLHNAEGDMIAVVCLRAKPEHTGVQIAALLAHEAVHVWQHFCESIGETKPSAEFEAYSVQALSQRLMRAYADSPAVKKAKMGWRK